MDKFAIDLDTILDELEENDDDSDRAHPPSLMKIANCNTFSYNNSNNYPSIYAYREDTHRRPLIESESTSSSQQTNHSNHYKRMFSYIDSHTIEKLDSSEAEFGISIKPIEIQNYSDNESNKPITNENNGFETQLSHNKEDDEEIEKNKLISTLLGHAKWSSDDTTQQHNDYDIYSTSSDEEISDEVLYVSIDQNIDSNKHLSDKNVVSSEGQIEIKLLPSNSLQLINEENTSSVSLTQNDVKDQNDMIDNCLKSLETEVSDNNSTVNVITSENDIIHEIQEIESKESLSENMNQLNEQNFIERDSDLNIDLLTEEYGHKCETSSIDNNNDSSLNVVKFSDIEVNVDDLTEHEIDNYLSDLNEYETNQFNNLDINSNNNNNTVETSDEPILSDFTSEELINTNSDKDLTSISHSTSTVSNEEIDQNLDFSEYDVCSHTNISTNSSLNNSNNNNNCDESITESIEQHSDDNIPSKLLRPNTLPILSNAIQVNPVLTEEVVANNQINDNIDNNEINDNNQINDNNEINEINDMIDINDNNDVPNNNYSENRDYLGQNLMNGLSEEEQMLGKIKPFWIPDQETQMCMHCDIKFTVLKRRHHCRACGKVLCAQCCNNRAKLVYLDNKDARVCQICYSTLTRMAEIERSASDSNQSSPSILGPDSLYADSASGHSNALNMRCPDPNNPSEYCSTISPLEQEQDVVNRPPLSVMVPVGVLKKPDRPRGEPKQVVFSDGIRPGGDLTETNDHSHGLSFLRRSGRVQLKLKSPPVESVTSQQSGLTSNKSKASRIVITDSNGTLPPIINYYDLTCNNSLKGKPSILTLIELMRNKDLCPVVFAVTKNLHIRAKLVIKDCCIQSECWTFSSIGLSTIGQDEILVNLERLPEEETFPRDIFRLFTLVYDNASKGTAFNDLSHVFFPDGLFGNKDNSGFLFIRPSLQCFNKLIMPSPPFLIAILIHKWEIPWAKVFPLRLVLRLGAEYKYYPCPIVSYRCRKPAYCEIGHTIMNVLADFRNFQYTLPIVPGLVIHLEEKKITLHLPRNRYEKVLKVLTNSNEHVLAFGANFSPKADSHLVCMQNDDGQYQTQSINIEGAARKITGASFIVFSGALKSSTGLTAKMSIVEDGLLVQIPPNSMSELRNSLKDMKNYIINCGKINDAQPDEAIHLSWGEEDTNFNLGVRSPIDGSNLEGIQSIRIYNGTDYTNDKFVIRWTEVFFLHMNESNRRSDSLDPSRLAETVSQAFCLALTSYLDQLHDNGFTKIGLRINLDTDKVGYETGSKGMSLPSLFTSELDGALIPVIMENIATGVEDLLVMELLFHILIK